MKQAKCRMCGWTIFREVIDMGEQPAVNSLLGPDDLEQKEKTYPLVVDQCQECFLVQITTPISSDAIYRNEDYLYFSGDMPTLADYFAEYADDLKKRFVDTGDFVVEIGSNDGTMLEFFMDQAVVFGIDPASNVVSRALRKGIPTLSDYFTERLAKSIRRDWGRAKVIYGNNCIAHIDNLDDVMRGVKALLRPDGVFVVECNYWGGMVKNKNYSLIYHDHFSYFSLMNWVEYAKKFDLRVFDAVVTPAQGGSLRLFISRDTHNAPKMEKRMVELLDEEGETKLNSYKTAEKYGKDVRKKAKKLQDQIFALREKGKRIAGYGAAAKGFSILSLAEIDHQEIIEYFIDDSPAKQGKWAPVSRIPVYAREQAVEHGLPDVFIITAPNYAKVIKEKERSLGFTGEFIVP